MDGLHEGGEDDHGEVEGLEEQVPLVLPQLPQLDHLRVEQVAQVVHRGCRGEARRLLIGHASCRVSLCGRVERREGEEKPGIALQNPAPGSVSRSLGFSPRPTSAELVKY